VRITLGGMRGPDDKLTNFLFQPSVPHGAPVTYRFLHMTHPGGKAFMTLKDPGFEHPASPKDYPAAVGGLGFTFEREEAAPASSLEPEQSLGVDGGPSVAPVRTGGP